LDSEFTLATFSDFITASVFVFASASAEIFEFVLASAFISFLFVLIVFKFSILELARKFK